MEFCADHSLLTTLKPVFTAKQPVDGGLIKRTPAEGTSLQNAVLLHDLHRRVCEPRVLTRMQKCRVFLCFMVVIQAPICYASRARGFLNVPKLVLLSSSFS